ncbi:MAG: hypothetical protein GX882_10395 [Methanomicrobiales archaeon]|nr:hypothetical protein [Methanomicrobiales archaeon]
MKKKVKAIALLSGGLDSVLAIALLQAQGVQIIGLAIETGFCSLPKNTKTSPEGIEDIAKALNIPLRIENIHEDYWDTILNPKYGYGKHMNPCMDCHLHMVRVAAEVMKEENADLVVSGEVLGQRPKSQLAHQMKIILQESGIEGRLLRPLSALCLEATIPELEGKIDRSALKGFRGRSRRPQLQLAKDLGVEHLAFAGGGNCYLTDAVFSARFRDLLKQFGKENFPREDVRLLRIGRHFRISPLAYLIVSRNEEEEGLLQPYRQRHLTFDLENIIGATAIGLGSFGEEERRTAAKILSRYSKAKAGEEVKVIMREEGESIKIPVKALPKDDVLPEKLRVGG